MSELKSYRLSLRDGFEIVLYNGDMLLKKGSTSTGDNLTNPYLCSVVVNFQFLWGEIDGSNVNSLASYIFEKVLNKTNFDLSMEIAKQIRNTVIDMLPCEMTVEDFSCIIDSAVNKYKE